VGDVRAQLPRLAGWHAARVQHDRDFQNLLQDVAAANELRKNNVISLNEAVRRKERAVSEKRMATLLGATGTGASGALIDDGLQFNERRLDRNLAVEKTRKTINDALLDEAVSIVSDSAALKEGKSQAAASALPIRPEVVMALPKDSSAK
jgi:carboxyl-terminal processing protease